MVSGQVELARVYADLLESLNTGATKRAGPSVTAVVVQLRNKSIEVARAGEGLQVDSGTRVKIDRSFIMDLESSREDRALVKAVTYLAHKLGARVCAEGVEDELQLKYLEQITCDEYQGYYRSRPVEPESFVELLTDS